MVLLEHRDQGVSHTLGSWAEPTVDLLEIRAHHTSIKWSPRSERHARRETDLRPMRLPERDSLFGRTHPLIEQTLDA